MTTDQIADTLQNWLERLQKHKDKLTGLERRAEAEKGKIARLEAKIIASLNLYTKGEGF